jgi:predicted nucleic acid-binding protein
MAERLLLDTDVLIEYLRGRPKAIEYLEGLTSDLCISAVSVAELFAGIKGDAEERSLEQFLLASLSCPLPKKWRGSAVSTGETSDRVMARA